MPKKKAAVRYFSKGGKTKKIADAIARGAGVSAAPVSEPLKEPVDVLFLGTAPYGFDVDDAVKDFIRAVNVPVGKVVLFSTSAVLSSVRKYVEKPLAEKKLPLETREFACRGEFLVLHRGKPDKKDEENAEAFAREMLS